MKKIIIAVLAIVMVFAMGATAFAAVEGRPGTAVAELGTTSLNGISTEATTDDLIFGHSAIETIGEEKFAKIDTGAGVMYPIFGGHGGNDTWATVDLSGTDGIAFRVKNGDAEASLYWSLIVPTADKVNGADQTASGINPYIFYLISKDLTQVQTYIAGGVGADFVAIPANFDGYLGVNMNQFKVAYSGAYYSGNKGTDGIVRATASDSTALIFDMSKVGRWQQMIQPVLGADLYIGDVVTMSLTDLTATAGPAIPSALSNFNVVGRFETLVDADCSNTSLFTGGGSDVTVTIVKETGNQLVKLTNGIAGETTPHMFGVLSPVPAGYDASNATHFGFYVKTGDSAASIRHIRLYTATNAMAGSDSANNSYLYDMDGYLVGDLTSIPENFEGFALIGINEDAKTALGSTFMMYMSTAEEDGYIAIDSFGFMSGTPSTATRPTPTPTPTPTPEATTPAPEATTPAPEGTTPPTGNPNTGAVSVLALAAAAVVSGGMIVLRKKHA